MVNRSKKNNISKLVTFENLLGLVLAFLIVFDLKVETTISHAINSPVGIVLSLIILVTMFILLNPIVGLLFLIYIYETVKYSSSFFSDYLQPVEKVKNKIMKNLNLGMELPKDQVEIQIVERMAPIVRVAEKSNVTFKPKEVDNSKYTVL